MKSNQSLKVRAFSGIAWKLCEKVGMQVVQFIIQIVLARLLLPEDYGLVGLLSIFIAVSDVFIQQGFTTALIQKKDTDSIDFSTVFYANIVMSVMIYIILYISAPLVALFYNEPDLILIMRVLSLNVIIGATCAVHNSIMAKKLDFKKSFIRNLSNIFTQGIVGIILAYMNYGVWALVYSKLAGLFVGAIVLCVTVRWFPRLEFSFKRLKSLFTYSSKVLGTNLLNTIFNNLHSLVIGRYFTQAELGFYQRGQQMPQVIMGAVDGSLNEVMYPTFSLLQGDIDALKSALRRSMKVSMFFVLPILMGLIVISEQLICVLLTEKWLQCVPFMKLSCIICAFWPLSARTHALNAIGKSDITFRLSLISKTVTVCMIVVCIRFGIYAIMMGSIISTCITIWISSYYINKYIHYSLKELLGDLFPIIAISLTMMLIVMLLGQIKINIYLGLLLRIIVGITIYIVLAKIFKLECFKYLLDILRNMKRGKKNR